MSDFKMSKFASDVKMFHDLSGLSWAQVGRCLGVPARTAQWWATGHAKTVKSASARVSRLLAQVIALNLSDPAERRIAILKADCDTPSLLSVWKKEAEKNYQVLHYSQWQLSNKEMSDYE